MSIKEGNNLYRVGRFEESIAEYRKVDSSSPLYQQAKYNIERVTKILCQSKQKTITSIKIHPKSRLTIEKLPPVKGVMAADSLYCSLGSLNSAHYYCIDFETDVDIPMTVLVRDGDRNLPLYQSEQIDVRTKDHIFMIPPSIKSDIQLTLHPSDIKVSLSDLTERILVTVRCLGPVENISFKPNGLKKTIVASMATIISRLDIAIDAVYSLLSQVDRVHIHINDSSIVPKSLQNERIIVTTESMHGNLGDSGKFIGAKNSRNSYILVCDDDFIFPHDFILQSYLKLAAEDFNVIVGMHGIYLRYPLEDYYADDARNTMHITTGFSFETTASAVGTGAIFFDGDVFPANSFVCDYKNMADIWFALECNRLQLPILIQKRRTNWIIDNPPSDNAQAIWRHSSCNVKSEANTREMQSYVLSAANGCISTLPLKKNRNGKEFLLVIDYDIFEKTVETLEKISKTDRSPAIIYVQNTKDLSLAKKISRGIYSDIIFNNSHKTLKELASTIPSKLYCFFLEISGNISMSLNQLEQIIDNYRCHFNCLTTSFDVVVGPSDSKNDFYVRYLPVFSNTPHWVPKVDGRISGKVAEKTLEIFKADGKPLVDSFFDIKKLKSNCIYKKENKIKFSTYFDKIYLLNLDRRPDRLESFSSRASKFGINFERFSAVDGSLQEIVQKYEKEQKKLKSIYGHLGHKFNYESSLYCEYKSEAERISHILQSNGKTYSCGGYGYMSTYKNIIEDAIKNNYEHIAIFDDDCIFHKDLDKLFENLIFQIPDDWVTISLGTLQYDWRNKFINWLTPNVYRCGGFSVGSHAQAYSRTAFPILLEYIERYTLPFDVGALHYLKRHYSTRSFVSFPNLFIQDVTDTDIGDSKVQLTEGSKKNNVYKWNLNDYE